jgi:hypothetical protein
MPTRRKPPLTVPLILEWADAHQARTGTWPRKTSASVKVGYLGDNWLKIDNALKLGQRGLKGGSTLAHLLVEARRLQPALSAPLAEETVLAWAARHYAETGRWPTEESSAVPGEKGENLKNIGMALRQGLRGLPGGSRLARLLEKGAAARSERDLEQLVGIERRRPVELRGADLGQGFLDADPGERLVLEASWSKTMSTVECPRQIVARTPARPDDRRPRPALKRLVC